jgi:hypothetical protein
MPNFSHLAFSQLREMLRTETHKVQRDLDSHVMMTLTPKVPLQEIIFCELVKKPCAFYETKNFITALKRALHLGWVIPFRNLSFRAFKTHFNIIHNFTPKSCEWCDLFSGLPPRLCKKYVFLPMHVTQLTSSFWIELC